MTDDLIRPVRGAFPGPAIEPNSGIRAQLALLGKVGVRYGGLGVAPSLLDNLVAYYKLDETSGPRIDSVGSNNMTDNGSVGSAVGKVGNAASFDGTNWLSTSPLTGITSDLSISLWAYIRSLPDAVGGVIANKNNWGAIWITRFATTQILGGRIVQSDGTQVSFPGPASAEIPLNTWLHIVLIVDSASLTATLYRDTTAINSLTYDGTIRSVAAGTLKIGLQGTEYIDGLIDEVGIWNRALTAAEIAILYNGGSGITFPF
jgi:hypothetical protein